MKACQEKNIKPILGIEAYIAQEDSLIKTAENRSLNHLCLLAKNTNGWKSLLKIVALSNHKDNFYYKPRLSLDKLAPLCKDLIAFSGHPGSDIADRITDFDGNIKPNWERDATRLALWFKEVFGEDFYLEVQLIDGNKKLAECIRSISNKTGIKCIGTPDAHYCKKEQAIDQQVLLCNNMKVTLKEANKPDFPLKCFFNSDNFHIPSYDEMINYGNTEEELEHTLEISSKIGEYNILRNPVIPPFQCPNNALPDDYLRELCRGGWRKLIQGKVDNEEVYVNRVKEELDTFKEAGLASYFLIVQDILKFVTTKEQLKSPGRGSAAGCLVSYLSGITGIDPIKYNLLFSRFYNKGRNKPGHISLPDIDVDVPKYFREEVIQYLQNKYGANRVAQLGTFMAMKGRESLKDVLRVHNDVTFEEMNTITSQIPSEAKIAGELQEMKEDGEEASSILWALQHTPKKFKAWCWLEDGKLQGPLAERFAQAIRLDGTKTTKSRHASGIIISPESIEEVFPICYDGDNIIVDLEMNDAEALGGTKLDILGLTALDKLMKVEHLCKSNLKI